MSKELTEQWRNGTLKDGFYYVKEDEDIRISPCSRHYLLGVLKDCEVLAPVPTYEEYLKLESDSLAKQEGVELVAELENAISSQADYFRQQISVLEDRLKEAETVILLYFKNTQNATYQSLGMNDGYYKKAFIHAVAKEYLEKYKVEEK